jgi:P-type E1-E2 ATPase
VPTRPASRSADEAPQTTEPEGRRSQGGLTDAEAARRLAARGATPPVRSSRSYPSIGRANVFTVFNLILAIAGAATLAFGEWQDALFLGVLVANAAIGSVQEIRAKRALDRLSALVAPRAAVVRDGRARTTPVEEVVVGDLVRVGPGDQVVADGTLEQAETLRVDESILTGESEPVARTVGDSVRSGSFAVEGVGAYVVSAVGVDSYAALLTGEARSFRHPRSPLERALNQLLFVLVAVMVPLGIALGYALWHRQAPLHTAVPTSVAAGVTLVPEGLILLASLTYAVAALRMARRGALVQQLNGIESLASVDVVCLDKTGTLTEPSLRVVDLVGPPSLADELGRYAASATARNATLEAVANTYPAAPAPVEEQIPFSSRQRFGAQRIGGVGYVLGAPEHFELHQLAAQAEEAAAAGRRVLGFGTADRLDEQLPRAHGLVVLAEQLRPEARSTVEWFRAEGVELKVLSGDRPETVAAIARDVGIDGAYVDASSLPSDASALREAVLGNSVFGRISPEDKRRVVEALRESGRYVAMVGDGVNDVPALKAARLAIAQGTGTQMARTVADVVLVRGEFAAVPSMVAEGRQILRNVQRVAKLFVTKSAFAAFLVLSIGLTPTAYPLLPRQLTLAASLTIGIPGFFLALAPSTGRYRPEGFLRELARFALPAGTAAGLGVLTSYLFALNVLDLDLVDARTVAVTVVVLVGLYLILALEVAGRVRGAAVSTLCLLLLGSYVLVLLVPLSRDYFALAAPSVAIVMTALAGAAVAVAGLAALDDRFIPGRGAGAQTPGARDACCRSRSGSLSRSSPPSPSTGPTRASTTPPRPRRASRPDSRADSSRSCSPTGAGLRASRPRPPVGSCTSPRFGSPDLARAGRLRVGHRRAGARERTRAPRAPRATRHASHGRITNS